MATPIQKLKQSEFKRRVVAGSFPCFPDLPAALNGMGFVQADPIRAPARAQDLVLRQRVPCYSAGDLESQFPQLDAEEGYLFAYGFMTPEVWRNLRWRPYRKLKKLEREVLDAVAELGEVHPRELDEKFGRKSVKNYWGGKSSQTKRILEELHHHGFLRVSRRLKGIRVYQVPDDDICETEDPLERYRNLALATARAFGPCSKRFLVSELRSQNHLLPNRLDRIAAVDSLVESGSMTEVQVADSTYLWMQEDWPLAEPTERVRVLAPFDPLVRDRDRFAQLWDWNYRFEAYVPAAKRERGYYAMPVLWRDDVVGWANAKVVDDCLDVEVGFAEKRPQAKAFRVSLENEVESMATFLGLASGAWTLTF